MRQDILLQIDTGGNLNEFQAGGREPQYSDACLDALHRLQGVQNPATASERVEFHHRRHGRRRLRRENVRNEIRYVSAWFDDELTKLEGAA